MKYEELIFVYPFSIGSFLNAKISLKGTLEEGDTLEECYARLSADVKALADRERGSIYDAPPNTHVTDDEPGQYKTYRGLEIAAGSKPKPEERRIGDIANDIRSCKDRRILETYRLMVKGKPDLEEAYNEMLEKLKG